MASFNTDPNFLSSRMHNSFKALCSSAESSTVMRGMAAEAIDCFQLIKGMIERLPGQPRQPVNILQLSQNFRITKKWHFYAAIFRRRSVRPHVCESYFTPFHHVQLPMVAEAHQSILYQKKRVMRNLQANPQRNRSAVKRNSCKCTARPTKHLHTDRAKYQSRTT